MKNRGVVLKKGFPVLPGEAEKALRVVFFAHTAVPVSSFWNLI